PLPPSAVEGWGGGKVRPLRRKSSRPTPPPSRPSPACGGRSRACPAPPPPVPPPPARGGGAGWGPSAPAAPQNLAAVTAPPRPARGGGGGGGARSDGRATRPRVGRGPHPGLPPHAGERAGRPSRLHSRDTPSPASGGGPGWGRTMPPGAKKGPAIRGAPAV